MIEMFTEEKEINNGDQRISRCGVEYMLCIVHRAQGSGVGHAPANLQFIPEVPVHFQVKWICQDMPRVQ